VLRYRHLFASSGQVARAASLAGAILRAEEVPILLAHVPDGWRPLFATALYTGMRKGELIGLRKTDVDLATRTITVARSYARDATKGGHADAIPVPSPLEPYLAVAMGTPGDLVFPAPTPARRRRSDRDRAERVRSGRAFYAVSTGRLSTERRRAGRPDFSWTSRPF
jgi:integrase